MCKYQEFEIKSFMKIVILKVDYFMSEVVDECNFDLDDESGMESFVRKYVGKDEYCIVRVEM